MERPGQIGYPVAQWVATILFAPVVLCFYEIFFNSYSVVKEDFNLYIFMVVIGGGLSFPVLAIHILMYAYLVSKIKSDLLLKMILNVIASLFVVLFFNFFIESSIGKFSLSYVFVIFVSSIFLKLRNTRQPTPS